MGVWCKYRQRESQVLLAVHLSSFRLKALSGTVTIMDRRVAYHQPTKVFIPSLYIMKKGKIYTCANCYGRFFLYIFVLSATAAMSIYIYNIYTRVHLCI